MNRSSDHESRSPSRLPRWTWWVLGTVVVLHGVWWFVSGRVAGDSEAAAQLGDRFGFTASLLSGLAFWGLIVTMLMQRQELALQREELALQREEMRESRMELAKAAAAQEKLADATKAQTDVMAIASLVDAEAVLLSAATMNRGSEGTLSQVAGFVASGKHRKEVDKLIQKLKDRSATSADD